MQKRSPVQSSLTTIIATDQYLLTFISGDVKLVPLPQREVRKPQPQGISTKLSDTHARRCLNIGSYELDFLWNRCKELVSQVGNPCTIGSWVFYNSPLEMRFSLQNFLISI
jgi:hypothetical protein